MPSAGPPVVAVPLAYVAGCDEDEESPQVARDIQSQDLQQSRFSLLPTEGEPPEQPRAALMEFADRVINILWDGETCAADRVPCRTLHWTLGRGVLGFSARWNLRTRGSGPQRRTRGPSSLPICHDCCRIWVLHATHGPATPRPWC